MILIHPVVDHVHLCHSVKLLPDEFLYCEITLFLFVVGISGEVLWKYMEISFLIKIPVYSFVYIYVDSELSILFIVL